MTVSEKTVFKLAADYAARLGVSCPEIVVQNSRVGVHDYGMRKNRVGECGGNYIMIDRRRGFHEVSHTVAHEFIHRAFPRLQHGKGFDERARALQKGDMMFRGSIRRPDRLIETQGKTSPGFVYGKTIWYDMPLRRSVILDTEMPKEPVDKSEQAKELEARIRKFDTKIKRLTTLRKKLERKLKRVSQ